MDDNRASSAAPKRWTAGLSIGGGRGAFRARGRWLARAAGAPGKANVGISNDKAGANPAHRKAKGS